MLQRGAPCASCCRLLCFEIATLTGVGVETPHHYIAAGCAVVTMMWSAFCSVQAARVPDDRRTHIHSLVEEKYLVTGLH